MEFLNWSVQHPVLAVIFATLAAVSLCGLGQLGTTRHVHKRRKTTNSYNNDGDDA